MSTEKKEKQVMSLHVTDGLTVTIRPDSSHEFLMPTKEVAKGYGVQETTIRRQLQNHKQEFVEGKHFINGVQLLNAAKMPYKLFTKRGIVRLGFFIKSKNAMLFRDWAEDLIINQISPLTMTGALAKQKEANSRELMRLRQRKYTLLRKQKQIASTLCLLGA